MWHSQCVAPFYLHGPPHPQHPHSCTPCLYPHLQIRVARGEAVRLRDANVDHPHRLCPNALSEHQHLKLRHMEQQSWRIPVMMSYESCPHQQHVFASERPCMALWSGGVPAHGASSGRVRKDLRPHQPQACEVRRAGGGGGRQSARGGHDMLRYTGMCKHNSMHRQVGPSCHKKQGTFSAANTWRQSSAVNQCVSEHITDGIMVVFRRFRAEKETCMCPIRNPQEVYITGGGLQRAGVKGGVACAPDTGHARVGGQAPPTAPYRPRSSSPKARSGALA
jgi:hypothetical protein